MRGAKTFVRVWFVFSSYSARTRSTLRERFSSMSCDPTQSEAVRIDCGLAVASLWLQAFQRVIGTWESSSLSHRDKMSISSPFSLLWRLGVSTSLVQHGSCTDLEEVNCTVCQNGYWYANSRKQGPDTWGHKILRQCLPTLWWDLIAHSSLVL